MKQGLEALPELLLLLLGVPVLAATGGLVFGAGRAGGVVVVDVGEEAAAWSASYGRLLRRYRAREVLVMTRVRLIQARISRGHLTEWMAWVNLVVTVVLQKLIL